MTDLSARATIRKEIQERLSGIAEALEGSMGGDTNVDVYTPSQVIQLIVNAIKWAPPKPETAADASYRKTRDCEHQWEVDPLTSMYRCIHCGAGKVQGAMEAKGEQG